MEILNHILIAIAWQIFWHHKFTTSPMTSIYESEIEEETQRKHYLNLTIAPLLIYI